MAVPRAGGGGGGGGGSNACSVLVLTRRMGVVLNRSGLPYISPKEEKIVCVSTESASASASTSTSSTSSGSTSSTSGSDRRRRCMELVPGGQVPHPPEHAIVAVPTGHRRHAALP